MSHSTTVAVPLYHNSAFQPGLDALSLWLEDNQYSQHAREAILAHAAAHGTPSGSPYLDAEDEAGAAFVDGLEHVPGDSSGWDDPSVFIDADSLREAAEATPEPEADRFHPGRRDPRPSRIRGYPRHARAIRRRHPGRRRRALQARGPPLGRHASPGSIWRCTANTSPSTLEGRETPLTQATARKADRQGGRSSSAEAPVQPRDPRSHIPATSPTPPLVAGAIREGMRFILSPRWPAQEPTASVPCPPRTDGTPKFRPVRLPEFGVRSCSVDRDTPQTIGCTRGRVWRRG